MKITKSNVTIIIVCTAALSAAAFISGAAAPDGDYNSRGKIVFDNDTQDPTDDVIFDASDFWVIDGMVSAGKSDIKDALNEYDNINISEDIPSFETLAESISGLCDGTDAAAANILSGKKALVEKCVITGTMPDYGSITTPADGISEFEEEEAAEITIPEGYYNQDSRISIPIKEIKEKVPSLNNSIIIQAVNNRGGDLADDATNVEIANAINTLDLTVLGTVEYEYHHHDDNCYGACGSKSYRKHHQDNGGGDEYNIYICEGCGAWVYDEKHPIPTPLDVILSRPCGNSVLKCGYSDGQIISATIKY